MAQSPGISELINQERGLRRDLAGNLLILGLLAALFSFFPLFSLDPNRVVRGNFFYLTEVLTVFGFPGILTASLFAGIILLRGYRYIIGLMTAAVIFLWFLPLLLISLFPDHYSLRFSPSGGFWATHLVLAGAIILRGQNTGKGRFFSLVLFILSVVLGVMLPGNPHSLVMEFKAQQGRFLEEFIQHFKLSGTALGLSLCFALPLGVLSVRKTWAKGLISAAGVLQTLPSLALFGLLMVPLAWLAQTHPWLKEWGISGIGPAPAVIALALYALLPLMNGIHQGLLSVPQQTLDAGRGAGFSSVQLFWRVELPLALPLVAGGLRTAVVQTLGNAVLASLIGAGGMGFFIFQGVGQTSADMVVLGVLGLVALTLGSDALFGALQHRLYRRFGFAPG